MKASELAAALKPFILQWLATAGSGSGYAPSPHDLGGAHHSGTLQDSQFLNALLRDGSRSLLGNLAVAAGVTIDGVDVDAFRLAYDVHAAATAAAGHSSIGAHTHQNAGEGGVIDHGDALSGLEDDDHAQYVHTAIDRIITALHSFAPAAVQAPFSVGANAQYQVVGGLMADVVQVRFGAVAPASPTAGMLWVVLDSEDPMELNFQEGRNTTMYPVIL